MILLGTDRKTGRRVYLPDESFKTHYHLLGGTGAGKTTAIESVQHQMFASPVRPACHLVIDRMGAHSYSLLNWFASPYCPPRVRKRLVYIEGANEHAICTFNPLSYQSLAHGHYAVGQATDCILRAWASQNIAETPRLAKWIFNAFWSAAQLGLTVSDCAHFLMPGSPLHAPLLRMLPPMLQAEWNEIREGRGGDAGRMLEAPRNRLAPFFNNPILKAVFGSTESRLDVLRFMREQRVVIVNLAPMNRLSAQVADAFGGMLLNQVLSAARSLPMGERHPTYFWGDEFQRMVGPDTAEAIPEVRQLGLRFVCSHQSMSQLKRGETDMSEISYQLRSKMIFGVQGRDADDLAHELAAITYDPLRVKDEMRSLRQIQTGHEVRLLKSWQRSEAEQETWAETYGSNWSAGSAKAKSSGRQHTDSKQSGYSRKQDEMFNPTFNVGTGRVDGSNSSETETDNNSSGGSHNRSDGGGRTTTTGGGEREQLVPVLENFYEVTKRSFYDFNEQAVLWGQSLRNQSRGQCVLRLANDPKVYEVDVERHAPGYLSLDLDTLRRRLPHAVEAIAALMEVNFSSEMFVTPEEVEHETQLRLERILNPVIELREPLAIEDRSNNAVIDVVPVKVANPMA